MQPITRSITCLLALVLVIGCKRTPAEERSTTAPVSAREQDPEAHAFFEGEGKAATLDEFSAGLADVDFVAVGEIHRHPVGSEVELAVLQAMAAQPRPVALAMEFFEADDQPALDEYLTGSIDEATFRERTERDDAYETSHRPLVEFAKANGIPVLAANAPRTLVTAYRKSKQPYAEWLAEQSESDRQLLPRSSVPPHDEFERRFLETMGPERGPAFYPAMCLWNDAMAESSGDFRESHPEHRILLVVGAYHVAGYLGVITQYRARRPDDSVAVLLMAQVEGPFGFRDQDRGEGDLILQVH